MHELEKILKQVSTDFSRAFVWSYFYGDTPYGGAPYRYLNFEKCSDLAVIWFTDQFWSKEFISVVKSYFVYFQRLSDRPCEKKFNFERVLRNGQNLVYRHFIAHSVHCCSQKNFLYLQRLSDRLCEKPVENCKIVSNLIFPIIVFIFFIYWCSSDNSFNIYSDILFNNILCGYRTALCVRLIKKIPWSLSRVSIRDRTRSTMAVYK